MEISQLIQPSLSVDLISTPVHQIAKVGTSKSQDKIEVAVTGIYHKIAKEIIDQASAS